MCSKSVKENISVELTNALAARNSGLEGRARVCARRAAGLAVREYARTHPLQIGGSNAYELLTSLSRMQDVDSAVRRCAELLSLRVDEDYQLPETVDLIAEAERIVELLCG